MDSAGYKQTWLHEQDLESLSTRIHDGVQVEQLAERAADRRDTLFERLFPYARPGPGARVLELGPGVGWIMQAMLEAFPIESIVGLDISAPILSAARQRWNDARASYVAYDGLRAPLRSDSFDNVYSVACLQHIEKHHAFLIMRELHRLLRPGGHGTLHLMSVHHVARTARSYEEECWNHVNNADWHWMHYYSYDELFMLFSQAMGVTDLDIKYAHTSFWVHFSKGTGRRFVSDEIEQQYFPNRAVPPAIWPRAGKPTE